MNGKSSHFKTKGSGIAVIVLFRSLKHCFVNWKLWDITTCCKGNWLPLWEIKKELRRKLKDCVISLKENLQSRQAVNPGSCLKEEDGDRDRGSANRWSHGKSHGVGVGGTLEKE